MKDWFSLSEYFNESFDEEILSQDQRYNEYVMTSLRTIWGCDLRLVQQEFGLDYLDYLTEQANKHIADGMLFEDKKRIFLTPKGKLFADGIASDLFK